MADLSDVLSILSSTVESAVYPNGTASPSVANVDCKIFSGWPVPADLDTDIAAGKIQVSIYPVPAMDRNVSRFPKTWQTVTAPAPTLTASVSGTDLTIGGTVSTPQTVLALVDRQWYAYAVQSGDTLDTIATALGALIPGATVAGAVISVPTAYQLVGRVAAQGTSGKEIRRQDRVFKITIWSPSPTLRDTVSQAIDLVFAQTERIDMPDGFSARIIYRGTSESDELERQAIYRRDLNYSVEYATTITETDTAVEAIEVDVEDQYGNTILDESI